MMLKIRELSDEELSDLISQPMSDEEAQTLIQINESDRWLLSQSIREMESRELEDISDA